MGILAQEQSPDRDIPRWERSPDRDPAGDRDLEIALMEQQPARRAHCCSQSDRGGREAARSLLPRQRGPSDLDGDFCLHMPQPPHRWRQLHPNTGDLIWCNGRRESSTSKLGRGAELTDQMMINTPNGSPVHLLQELQKDLAEEVTRVFRLGGQWYFSTRDGDIGPFRTREQAKHEALIHESILRPAP